MGCGGSAVKNRYECTDKDFEFAEFESSMKAVLEMAKRKKFSRSVFSKIDIETVKELYDIIIEEQLAEFSIATSLEKNDREIDNLDNSNNKSTSSKGSIEQESKNQQSNMKVIRVEFGLRSTFTAESKNDLNLYAKENAEEEVLKSLELASSSSTLSTLAKGTHVLKPAAAQQPLKNRKTHKLWKDVAKNAQVFSVACDISSQIDILLTMNMNIERSILSGMDAWVTLLVFTTRYLNGKSAEIWFYDKDMIVTSNNERKSPISKPTGTLKETIDNAFKSGSPCTSGIDSSSEESDNDGIAVTVIPISVSSQFDVAFNMFENRHLGTEEEYLAVIVIYTKSSPPPSPSQSYRKKGNSLFYSAIRSQFLMIMRFQTLFEKAVAQQRKSDALNKLASHLCVTDVEKCTPFEIVSLAGELVGAEAVSLLLSSDDGSVFLVIFQNKKTDKVKSFSTEISNFSQTSIVRRVFKSGLGIEVAKSSKDREGIRFLDSLTGNTTTNLLCVPVKVEENITAVAIVSNKSAEFTEEDVELISSFTLFAAVSIRNRSYYKEMKRQKATADMILSTVKKVSESDIRDITDVNQSVIEGAQALCSADRCALFMVDEEYNQLVAELSNGSTIKIPIGSGIAGTVARTGIPVNIEDAYGDPRFNATVDKATGYKTNSILCYPIHCNNEVVAVAQLINKLDDTMRCITFNQSDEQLLKSFSAVAGIAIGNARLYEVVVAAGNDAMKLCYFDQSQSLTTKPTNYLTIVKPEIVSTYHSMYKSLDMSIAKQLKNTSFPIHTFDNRQSDLIPLIYFMFHDLGLIKIFNIDSNVMFTFLGTVVLMYRPIPYHSMLHAFDVVQTLYILLKYDCISSVLSDLEKLALLITGLVHDIDHMGLNNSFHLKAETPLGIIVSASGSSSVLELHHATVAVELLQCSQTAILSKLSQPEWTSFIKILTHVILSTDLTRHNGVVTEFEAIPNFNNNDKDHKLRLITILVVTADVSNAWKPFDTFKKWGEKLMKEFNGQGKQELACSLPQTYSSPERLFDRLISFYQSQVSFMNHIVSPLTVAVVSRFSDLSFIDKALNGNIAVWSRKLQICIVAHVLGHDLPSGIRYRYFHAWRAFAEGNPVSGF